MDANKFIEEISNIKNSSLGYDLYINNAIVIQGMDVFEDDLEIYVKGKSYDSDVYSTLLYLSKDHISGECTCLSDDDGPACEHICAMIYQLNDNMKIEGNKYLKDFVDYLLGVDELNFQISEKQNQLANKIYNLALLEEYDDMFCNNTLTEPLNTIGLAIEHTIANQKLYLTLNVNDKTIRIDDVSELYKCVNNNKIFEIADGSFYVNKETFDKKSLKVLNEYHQLQYNESNIEGSYYSYYQQNYLKITKNIINWLVTLDDVAISIKGLGQYRSVSLTNTIIPFFSFNVENGLVELTVSNDVSFQYINKYLLINLNNDKVIIANAKINKIIDMAFEFSDYQFNYLEDKVVLDDFYSMLRKYNLCDENSLFESEKINISYIYDIHGRNGVIEIYPYLKYDEYYLNPLIELPDNLDKKSANLSLLYLDNYNYIKLYDCYQISNHFDIINFFNYQIKSLPTNFEVILNDSIKNVYVEDLTDRIGLKVGFVDDLIQMELQFDNFDLKELKEIYDSIEKNNSYFKLNSGQIVNLNNKSIRSEFTYLESMNIDISRLQNTKIVLPKYYSLFINDSNHTIDKDKSFNQLSLEIDKLKNKEYPVPKINANLREYQVAGYEWLASNYELGFGSVLADDMGLGKTIQVITFLSYLYAQENKKKTLIIVPKALLYNWEHEFIKFNNEIKIKLIEGNKKERSTLIQDLNADIIITTYDLFKRDLLLYKDNIFECVVIDEAQAIKNDSTAVSKCVKELNTKHAIALSGTPIENNLLELSSLFEFVLPGYLGSKLKFKRQFEKPISQGDNNKMSQLLKLINPFILRRNKKEVLKDLPDKIEETIQCELTKDQAKIYQSYFMQMKNKFEDEYLNNIKANKIEILSLLTKLRQICCHPQLIDKSYEKDSGKLDATLELINNGLLGNNKILVFSQFTSMLSIIKERLDKIGIKYYYLDGKVSSKERLELCNEFNNGDDIKLFLISLKAGGSGLNLTSANMVIHYDQWWNPAVMDQASDRAHRYGQKNVVQIFNLVTRKTIEEKIMALQSDKKDLVAKVLNNDNTSLTSLSDDELRSLFEL